MNDATTIPIACSLTAEELPARRELLQRIGRTIQEVQFRENGYAYRFEGDEFLPELAQILQQERLCCPFLRFALTLEPGHGPLWLEISGPPGTQSFLEAFFVGP